MARPQKEGMDYFPHDVDAMSDDKIEVLRALHGNDGYVFYFGILEKIYRQPDFEYDVSDAETIQILSKKLYITVEVFHQILNTALKYDCFDAEYYKKTGKLTSAGVKKRAEIVVKKRENMREKYGDRVSAAETVAEMPQSKVKKSKVKKSKVEKSKDKEDISSRFFPPSIEEVTAYCNERKNSIDAERFIDYYAAIGWQVGKNKMKDWKAAVRTWEKRNDNSNNGGNKNAGTDNQPDKWAGLNIIRLGGD